MCEMFPMFSNCISSDLLEQASELLGRLKYVHFVVHLVLIEDLLEVLTVLVAVVNGDCDACSAKSARAANPVQVVLRISDPFVTSAADSLCRHVEVDHDLNLWYIDTSCKHVRRDDNTDFSCPELLDHFVSFLVAHLTKNDCRLEVLPAHHFVQAVRVILGVNEYDSLGHFADIENLFDELRLFAFLAAVLELLDVVERELLLLEVNLMGCTREL